MYTDAAFRAQPTPQRQRVTNRYEKFTGVLVERGKAIKWAPDRLAEGIQTFEINICSISKR